MERKDAGFKVAFPAGCDWNWVNFHDLKEMNIKSTGKRNVHFGLLLWMRSIDTSNQVSYVR